MLVSIITASFNNVSTIENTIQSVLSQSFTNIEYIVIDGNSTDGTLEILEKYRSRISKIVCEKDNGIYDALNKGLSLATGDVVGFLHADDFYASNQIISNIVDVFEHTNSDAVYGDLLYVDKNNIDKIFRYWQAGEFSRKKIKLGWMPPHPTLFVKNSIYKKVGFFDTIFKIAADYDMILRLFYKHQISVSYLPKVIVLMRTGGASNRNLKNIFNKMREDLKALRKNKIPFPLWVLFLKNISKIPQFIFRTNY